MDLTQPYIETGLAVVVPVKEAKSSAWDFLRPFSAEMWCTTGAFFLIVGAVVWILEHRINHEFRGHPKRQVSNVLWFTFSTMFFSQKENTKSTLGRAVLIIWLFVVLIISQSYTASLTSILTVQQLSTTIQGIDGLVSSNFPIGYQTGSFVQNYLSETFNIAKSRLVPLDSIEHYARALSLGPNRPGGVAAIVDEYPYIQLFLSKRCGFTSVGGQFSKNGWGFAFPKDSPLTGDMSTAILNLSESGQLQKITDEWLKNGTCGTQSSQANSNKFGLNRFWGLFLVMGIICFIALLVFFCRMIFLFTRHADRYMEDSNDGSHSFSSKGAKIVKSFASFVDEKQDSAKNGRLKKKRSGKNIDVDSEMYQRGSLPSPSDNFSINHGEKRSEHNIDMESEMYQRGFVTSPSDNFSVNNGERPSEQAIDMESEMYQRGSFTSPRDNYAISPH